MKKRVLLGLSGGVDSAISAKLLLEQGYDVVAGFMRNWDSTANNDILGNPTLDEYICPQEQDFLDAKKVADDLGIKIIRLDFINEYWENVFTYFIKEYEKGRTPNPDIFCNKFIKFDYFLKYALSNGFDYIAMGHYAGIKHDKTSFLVKACDENKDQTYFLSQLSQEQLAHTLFPLAKYTKPEIRKIAADLNLVVATKKDSTGICFIGERDFKNFLQNYIPAQSGNIIDYDTKKIIGTHSGVMYYTLNQSKGLGIGGVKGFNSGKWYVIGKSISKRELYVSNRLDNKYLKSDQVLVNEININNIKFLGVNECYAKFRYRQAVSKVKLEWVDDTSCYVTGDNLPIAITPGQACVFYIDEYCIGGGIIDKIYNNKVEIQYE